MPDAENILPEQPTIVRQPGNSAEKTPLSSLEADEQTLEQLPEHRDDILHAETMSELEAAGGSSSLLPGAGADRSAAQKDEVVIEVEKILEEGLGDFYEGLPPDAKAAFRKKGEEVSSAVAEMVRKLKVNVKKVTELISKWLQTIPGVNKFFLEQETKIKTDKIIELVEARKEDQNIQV